MKEIPDKTGEGKYKNSWRPGGIGGHRGLVTREPKELEKKVVSGEGGKTTP